MIYKGEDKALAITITDSAGVLQDIDIMTDLIIVLYSANHGTVLVEYRKVATAGYTTLLRVSATEYTAIVPKTITDTFPLANLLIECEIMKPDIRFPDGIIRTKGKGTIAQIKDSIIDE